MSITASDTLRAAENLMTSQPEALLHRVIKHVQTLFNCPDLGAVIPATNKVCLHLSEMQNFIKATQSQLALPPNTGVNAVMERIQVRLAVPHAAMHQCLFRFCTLSDGGQLRHLPGKHLI